MSTSTSTPPPRPATTTRVPKSASGPPRSRLPAYLGAAVLGVAGYYFYTAGGDAKVARKEAEHDAASASARLRRELPGGEKEAKQSAEEYAARAGSKFDSTVSEGKQRIAQGTRQLEENSARASNAVMGKIDEADRKIEAKAGDAKSGISSWFGGSK